MLLAIVVLYPVISAVSQSFAKDAGLDPTTGMFVEGGFAGVTNYKLWLLQDCGSGAFSCPPGTLGSQFWTATGVTFLFTVVAVSLETVLGFVFALVMHRDFKGRGVQFLHYDQPPTDETGVMRAGGPLIAWFTDPAGNVFSVIEQR